MKLQNEHNRRRIVATMNAEAAEYFRQQDRRRLITRKQLLLTLPHKNNNY